MGCHQHARCLTLDADGDQFDRQLRRACLGSRRRLSQTLVTDDSDRLVNERRAAIAAIVATLAGYTGLAVVAGDVLRANYQPAGHWLDGMFKLLPDP